MMSPPQAYRAALALLVACIMVSPAIAESGGLPPELLRPWYMDLGTTPGGPLPQSVPGLAKLAGGPDRHGLRRDTGYFIAYQFGVIAILYVAPESVSGWTDEQKDEYSLSTWWDNATGPSFDSDDFYINYLLHPYWGGTYYVRARERGYSAEQAFYYSAFLSALYEFGAEALFEEPSIQDLFATPVLGAVVGGYFMHVRDGIRDRQLATGHLTTGDRWVLALTDPLGMLNRQFDQWFGWGEARVHVQPYYLRRNIEDALSSAAAGGHAETEYGIRFHIAWR